MARNDPTDRDGVSRLSRRGLLALGATLAGTSGLGMFSESAAAHELMAFRDAFIGDDDDRDGLGSKGWLFFAKDTGALYYHDGTGWEEIEIGGQLADEDDDGLLEAPNHDGIDVGEVKANSVSTDQISDGVAGEGQTISRIAGDAGDFVPLFSSSFSPGEEVTVSSTSFTQIGERIRIPAYEQWMQNVDGNYGAWAAEVGDLTDGEEVTIRLRLSPETEETVTEVESSTRVSTEPSPLDIGSKSYNTLEAKVSGGEATIRYASFFIGGVIE